MIVGAIMPVAMFVIIIGMRKGLTRPGPLFKRISYCVSMVLRPPMPLPTMTPTRCGSRLSGFNPASFAAIFEAAMANWE